MAKRSRLLEKTLLTLGGLAMLASTPAYAEVKGDPAGGLYFNGGKEKVAAIAALGALEQDTDKKIKIGVQDFRYGKNGEILGCSPGSAQEVDTINGVAVPAFSSVKGSGSFPDRVRKIDGLESLTDEDIYGMKTSCNGVDDNLTLQRRVKKSDLIYAGRMDLDGNGELDSILRFNKELGGDYNVLFNGSDRPVVIQPNWLMAQLMDNFGNVNDVDPQGYGKDRLDTLNGIKSYLGLMQEGLDLYTPTKLASQLAIDLNMNSQDLIRLYTDMSLSKIGAQEVHNGMDMKKASSLLAKRKHVAKIFFDGMLDPIDTTMKIFSHQVGLKYGASDDALIELAASSKTAGVYWKMKGEKGPITVEDLEFGANMIYNGMRSFVDNKTETNLINYGGEK